MGLLKKYFLLPTLALYSLHIYAIGSGEGLTRRNPSPLPTCTKATPLWLNNDMSVDTQKVLDGRRIVDGEFIGRLVLHCQFSGKKVYIPGTRTYEFMNRVLDGMSQSIATQTLENDDGEEIEIEYRDENGDRYAANNFLGPIIPRAQWQGQDLQRLGLVLRTTPQGDFVRDHKGGFQINGKKANWVDPELYLDYGHKVQYEMRSFDEDEEELLVTNTLYLSASTHTFAFVSLTDQTNHDYLTALNTEYTVTQVPGTQLYELKLLATIKANYEGAAGVFLSKKEFAQKVMLPFERAFNRKVPVLIKGLTTYF